MKKEIFQIIKPVNEIKLNEFLENEYNNVVNSRNVTGHLDNIFKLIDDRPKTRKIMTSDQESQLFKIFGDNLHPPLAQLRKASSKLRLDKQKIYKWLFNRRVKADKANNNNEP